MENPFNNQFVRDLCWILTSPQMMQMSDALERKFVDLKWLHALDRDPRSLESHLADKNLRMLGTYFEALWEYYLSYYPGKQLLAKNLQVFADNATLGEFDFIYQEQETGEFCHLEVAVKYYLGLPTCQNMTEPFGQSSSQQFWFGPGSVDRLALKYRKLTGKQSQLSCTDAGRQALDSLGIETITPQICLLGYLFYPWSPAHSGKLHALNSIELPESGQSGQSLQSSQSHQPLMPPPERVNPQHLRGSWLPINQLPFLLASPQWWQIRHKPHWLAPVFSDATELMSNDQLQQYLTNFMARKKRPCLISRFEEMPKSADLSNLSQPRFVSKALLFIVPDDWPDAAMGPLEAENR